MVLKTTLLKPVLDPDSDNSLLNNVFNNVVNQEAHIDKPRLSTIDQQLIAAIQDGLPTVSRPYLAIAQKLNIDEAEVIHRLQNLKLDGTIKRMGVVVRHHELGYRANAMVVWNIPDDKVATIAKRIASFDCVTLCYQRPRCLPEWPYNLFSMIHGQDRESVLQHLDDIIDILEIHDIAHEPLFSTRRFKQRGGRFIKNKRDNLNDANGRN